MSLQELHYCKVFKHRNEVSLRKLHTPQTYTYYDTTLRDTKTLLLSRKQTFKVRKVATRESGQEVPWVVNTPAREHNKQFRVAYNSLWGSHLDCLSPKTPSLSQEEMKCGKRKRGKKEIRVEVMKVFYFSPSLPLSSILAGWSPDWVPNPQKSPKYPKFLRSRLRPVYISHLLSKHLPTPLDSPIPFSK